MKTGDIHDAKTHLSQLVDRAAKGEPFVIAKEGKPLVVVAPLNAPVSGQSRRFGFMIGQMTIPADFDRLSEDVIKDLFDDAP